MTLSQMQQLFASLFSQQLAWMLQQGWALTFGDFDRPDCKGHMPNSCHYVRLAADVNLFVGGVWQTVNCPEWQAAGAHWKALHPECAWGGDFKSGDLNHFSLRYQGRE